MRSPLIGITTRRLPASALGDVPAGVVDVPMEGVFVDYAESVSGAGGIPVIIPRSADAAALVDRLDGLLLSGGEDVQPSRYGAETGPIATQHDPGRDEFEIALIHAALERRLPILGICRGVQILNVALGGTLVQHLEIRDGFDHSMTDEPRGTRRHGIVIESGSMLAAALHGEISEDNRARVNSFHHQAIDAPGAGHTTVARADDGTIEAVEDAGRGILGVQWHPEMHDGLDPLFTWFIQFAAEQSADRKGTA